MRRSRLLRTLVVAGWIVLGLAGVKLAADTFVALTGSGPGGSYVLGDPWGYQTAEKVRQNFNVLKATTDGLALPQYWTGAASSAVSAEKNLGALSTGLVINTSGVPSAYAGSSCGTGLVATATNASGALTCSLAGETRATVPITDSEFKALPTTGKTLVAAPGANLYIAWNRIELKTKFGSGAYTGLNGTYAALSVNTGTGNYSTTIADDSTTTPALTLLSGFVAASAKRFRLVPVLEAIGGTGELYVLSAQQATGVDTMAAIGNQPLTLTIDNNGSGNLGGGNAANSLTAVVYYTIEAIP